MPASSLPGSSSRLTPVQWLICVIASIGFAFDIYELLMLPLVVRPALLELVGSEAAPGTPLFQMWVGRLFFIPAFAGGVFGLLGGYLTDRLGRRRVLTWSILLYAVSAFLAGFSTSIWMLLFLRCTTFIGVCVEFVAAVAWLAELFPDPHRKERVLGYTQAFSSVGGLLVAVVNGLLVVHAADLPPIHVPEWLLGSAEAIKDPHAAWRYTLMSGLIPAIPLIIIRPFLPESPAWQEKRAAGTLKRPSFAELFSPQLARTTIVTTIMFACSYGAAFGADSADSPDHSRLGRREGENPSGHRSGGTAGSLGARQSPGATANRRPARAKNRRRIHEDAGNRGADRPPPVRLARRSNCQPTVAAARFPGTRPADRTARLLVLSEYRKPAFLPD